MDLRTSAALRQPWSLRRSRDLLIAPDRPTWPQAQMLVFDCPVSSATVDAWLPSSLRRAAKTAARARATVFVADYPSTSFGIAYRECGVLLHAHLRGRRVVHCAWMVVDDDSAMILGRELLGFPKKLAAIHITVEDNHVSAQIVRRGIEVLSVDADLGESTKPSAAFPLPIVNVRGNPDVLPQVLWKMSVPERFHSGRRAHLKIAVAESVCDPLHELDLATQAEGAWLCVDLGIPPLNPGPLPKGIHPVGLVSPRWFAKRFPFTVF